jgi:hypothetical protein
MMICTEPDEWSEWSEGYDYGLHNTLDFLYWVGSLGTVGFTYLCNYAMFYMEGVWDNNVMYNS